MSKTSKKKQLAVMSSSALDSAFGLSPVLEGEDASAYRAFLERMFAIVRPSDVIEQMWTRQYVDLTWELNRYGALKVAVIKAEKP